MSDETTTKIAIVSVAAFLDTCGMSLDDIAKTGIGSAGSAHLHSIKTMVQQCALSLRSYAASYKNTTFNTENELQFEEEKEPNLAMQEQHYLASEQESKLARMMGFIEEEADGSIN